MSHLQLPVRDAIAALSFAPRDLHTESQVIATIYTQVLFTELAYTKVIETAAYQSQSLRVVFVQCNPIAYTVNRNGYTALVHVGKAQISQSNLHIADCASVHSTSSGVPLLVRSSIFAARPAVLARFSTQHCAAMMESPLPRYAMQAGQQLSTAAFLHNTTMSSTTAAHPQTGAKVRNLAGSQSSC